MSDRATPEPAKKTDRHDSLKPELLSKYHDQGKDLANRAEHGHLTEVIKELDVIRNAMKKEPDGKDKFNALMQNVKNSNQMDVNEDVQAASVKHLFGIGDKTASLQTLLFDDTNHDGIPDKLYGSMLMDGSKTQPEAKQPEAPKPAEKHSDGEHLIMINPYSEAAGDAAWKGMQNVQKK